MDVLLVGAGRMGCAHLQGLAHSSRIKRVLLIDPFEASREAAQKAWDATEQAGDKALMFVDWEDVQAGTCSAAVIATSAPGRLDIVRKCAERQISYVLAEKVLFQSIADYREAMSLSDAAGMKVHAHLPYRTVELFQALKAKLAGRTFSMTVTVGDRGLGCNALHYLDLCQFLADDEVESVSAKIDLPIRDNPRGDQLVEFSGRAFARFEQGTKIEVIYETGHTNLPVIDIKIAQGDAGSVSMLHVDMDGSTVESDDPALVALGFAIPYASKVAHVLVEDIMEAKSVLPDLGQGLQLNAMMINAFNQELSANTADDMVCPIT